MITLKVNGGKKQHELIVKESDRVTVLEEDGSTTLFLQNLTVRELINALQTAGAVKEFLANLPK